MRTREVGPDEPDEASTEPRPMANSAEEVGEFMQQGETGWILGPDDDRGVVCEGESVESTGKWRMDDAGRVDVLGEGDALDPALGFLDAHGAARELPFEVCFRSVDALGVGVTSHVVAHLACPTLRDRQQRRTTRRAGLQRMHPPNSRQTSDPWSGRGPRHTWSPLRGRTGCAGRGRCPS